MCKSEVIPLIHTVQAVLGDERRCRLCHSVVSEEEKYLADLIQLNRPYCKSVLPFFDILSSIGIHMDLEYDWHHVFCKECSDDAINSYIFKEFSNHSRQQWSKVGSCLAKCDFSSLPSGKSIYIVLNDTPKVLSTLKGKKKKQASKVEKTYRCMECDTILPSQSKFQLHKDRYHGEKTLKCEHCPRLFASTALVDEHVRAMHTKGNCKNCGKEYNTRKGLKEHELTHIMEWACVCGKNYKYRDGLKTHVGRCPMIVKGKDYQVICPHCEKMFSHRATLLRHIEFAHSDNPIKCEVCDKKFHSPVLLRNHMSKHTGKKHYKCSECGNEFISSTTLKYHMRAIHTGEKPYPCNECDLSFITSSRRVEHKRKVHGAPAPRCAECGRSFTNLGGLRRHLKLHELEQTGETT